MSYESNTWVAGDVISAEKLNKIEKGIEAGDNSVLARVALTGDYNDLLNKLVWVEADTTETTLIDNKAFDVTDVTDMSTPPGKEAFSGWYAVSIVLDYNGLLIGDTLNITIDGVVYDSVMTFGEEDNDEMVFAGANYNEFETAESVEDLSYPFTLMCHLDDIISNRRLSLTLYTQDSAKSSATISLTNFHTDYVIHKLPSEYVDGKFIVSGTADGSEIFNDAENNVASGFHSHAEGSGTTASGSDSHAEGGGTKAISDNAHAEGGGTTASGSASHAEGSGTTASGPNSHAEGAGTTASQTGSHAEGINSNASGVISHAEGYSTTASGTYAHAECSGTIAAGQSSHAEGTGSTTSAISDSAHAEGYYAKASSAYQHVQGKYNVEDTNGTYAHIVGGGTSDNNRSNIHTLDWNGNAYFKGSLTLDNVTITPQQLSSLLALLNNA